MAVRALRAGGGARGFLVELDPRDAERVLAPIVVDVAVG